MQKSLNHSSGTGTTFDLIGVCGISRTNEKNIVDTLLKSGPNPMDCNKSVS